MPLLLSGMGINSPLQLAVHSNYKRYSWRDILSVFGKYLIHVYHIGHLLYVRDMEKLYSMIK